LFDKALAIVRRRGPRNSPAFAKDRLRICQFSGWTALWRGPETGRPRGGNDCRRSRSCPGQPIV